MQSYVAFKVLTVVEVAAVIVITWLAGTAVFRVFQNTAVYMLSGWNLKLYLSIVCEISATTANATYVRRLGVGRWTIFSRANVREATKYSATWRAMHAMIRS